jgi:Flp pilus assembly pilin Flp
VLNVYNTKKVSLKSLRLFFKDESGQALTEYVVFLAVLAGVILTVGKAFRNKMSQYIDSVVKGKLGATFFNPRAMHKFRL